MPTNHPGNPGSPLIFCFSLCSALSKKITFSRGFLFVLFLYRSMAGIMAAVALQNAFLGSKGWKLTHLDARDAE